MGKVIHWELGKKLKFGHTTILYMHKSESSLELHKIFWDFEIQANSLIPAQRPNLEGVNKQTKKERTCQIMDFTVPAYQSEKSKKTKKETST